MRAHVRPGPDRTDAPVPSSAVTRAPEADASGRLLDLQRRAGNRAVTQLVGGLAVQRHLGPTENAEVEDPNAASAEGQTPDEASTEAAGDQAESAAPVTGTPATAVPAEGAEAEGGAPSQDTAGTASPAPDGGESQPGTGTTGTGTGALTGDARKKAINDACRASNTGTWALEIIDKWSIPVNYEYTGQGSYHQGGKIFLNKSLGVGGAALVLMHEAQHASTYKSGKGADREKLSREDYIKRSIADEAEAVVRQLEGMAVTKTLGVDMAGAGVGDAEKERYLKAFYKKRDELKAANPSMSTKDINDACRKATRDGEVTNWFYDGTFVTSTNNNTYAVFYGLQWDEVHKKPGK